MLTFLLNNASKVYALFGYLWNRVKDAALNAWGWAVSKANEARQAAVNFANDLYWRARSYADLILGSAESFASGIVDTAKSIVLGWVNAARADASRQVEGEAKSREKDTSFTKAFVLAEAEKLRSYVDGKDGVLKRDIDKIDNRTLSWVDLIESLKNLLTVENLRRFVLLLTSFFPILLKLVTSPLEWIYSMISGSFVTFLCYILSRGLGTVKYALPPPPTWVGAAGGLFFPGPPGPDPSGGELAPPLDHLRISGYSFGPGHPGLDLGLARGAPVYAMHDGEVEVAFREETGYGHTITIRGGKWWSRYAHLDALGVSRGDKVDQRQKIGTGNSTGNSTGDHLHLEIKLNGVFIDPEAVLF